MQSSRSQATSSLLKYSPLLMSQILFPYFLMLRWIALDVFGTIRQQRTKQPKISSKIQERCQIFGAWRRADTLRPLAVPCTVQNRLASKMTIKSDVTEFGYKWRCVNLVFSNKNTWFWFLTAINADLCNSISICCAFLQDQQHHLGESCLSAWAPECQKAAFWFLSTL